MTGKQFLPLYDLKAHLLCTSRVNKLLECPHHEV